ncbi:hypothetical protein AB0F91_20215 [Amycolatopsis sp. NPDC023774]|uniref:hypothetical protein n=1 Tax=Amycolatopsis sp. NPDC023774 TaxID=3155015 RepID=UPI0033FF6556
MLGTLAIYGVSFFARPICGVVMGRVGDRHGRRTALAVSPVLMGLSTALIGVIPPYATIGFAAPLLLTLCRLVQGFAAAKRGLYVNIVLCFGLSRPWWCCCSASTRTSTPPAAGVGRSSRAC